MSGELTEEQRQRIEENRRRALQKKNQRQVQNNHAPNYAFDYNDNIISSSSHAPVPAFDYTEVPLNNHTSARESFGDSDINWDELIASERRQQNNNQNKRKLDNTNAQSSRPFGSHDINIFKMATAEDNCSSNGPAQFVNNNIKAGAQSKLTEDQRRRIEQNRLKALERKKQAPMLQMTTKCSHEQSRESTVHAAREAPILSSHNKNSSGLIQHISQISDEQKARIESNRREALEKKQQSTISSINGSLTNDQKAPVRQQLEAINAGASQCIPAGVLTEEQRALIEKKRLAALQKQAQHLNSSNVPTVQHSVRQQNYAHKSLSNTELGQNGLESLAPRSQITLNSNTCPSTETQQQPKRPFEALQKEQHYASIATSDSRNDSLTDEQRALIERKRLAALQKKQSLCPPKAETTQQSSFADEQQQIHRDEVDVPTRDINPDQIEVARDKVVEQTNINEVPPSPNKGKQKQSGLPPIPTDLQYDESRCLPIEDEHSNSLIENAELDQPLMNGWSLYDHQKEGVVRALRMRRLILAFDMGLGKYRHELLLTIHFILINSRL
jgi:hypothetical protein